MPRRTSTRLLVGAAILVLGVVPETTGWGETVAYAQRRGVGSRLKSRAAEMARNLRPVHSVRRRTRNLKRGFESLRRAKHNKHLSKTLGRQLKRGRLRLTKKGRAKLGAQRVEAARSRVDGAKSLRRKAQHNLRKHEKRAEKMEEALMVLESANEAPERMSEADRARIKKAFGSDIAFSGTKQQMRKQLEGRLKAQHKTIKRTRKDVKSALAAEASARLRLAAEQARVAQHGIEDVRKVKSFASKSLSKSEPQSGEVRAAVSDVIDLIDAFANVEDPTASVDLLGELAGRDLSKIERKLLQRARGRVIAKSVALLEARSGEGRDAAEVEAALREVKGQLRRRDMRLVRNINRSLRLARTPDR